MVSDGLSPKGSGSAALARDVIRIWDDVWNEGRVEALDDLLADSYTRYSVSRPNAPQSKDDLKVAIGTTKTAFPDLRTTVEVVVQEGDRLAICWRSEGTHLGALGDLPPTLKRVTVSGAVFAELDAEGRIYREVVTWDRGALYEALGIVSLTK
jgi:steroid delta-isomerase-like uncharacterized protein